MWSQKSKNNDTRHELTSVDVSFKKEETGKIYRADIEYQYSYTMAYYSVEVPQGTYVVDKIKVIQSSPHKIYEGEHGVGGFHWRDTLEPNGSTTHNFYFY